MEAIKELSEENKVLKNQLSEQSNVSKMSQDNEELRRELQQARLSLETLMRQARDAKAGEDARVARLRNELKQCEAGLEKQLLDALVDGSAAKAETYPSSLLSLLSFLCDEQLP